jgi:hypothetical protein
MLFIPSTSTNIKSIRTLEEYTHVAGFVTAKVVMYGPVLAKALRSGAKALRSGAKAVLGGKGPLATAFPVLRLHVGIFDFVWGNSYTP